jgi:hypothetical protein
MIFCTLGIKHNNIKHNNINNNIKHNNINNKKQTSFLTYLSFSLAYKKYLHLMKINVW